MDILIIISIIVILGFEYSRYIDTYRNNQRGFKPTRKCTINEKYYSHHCELEVDLETEYEITREWIDYHTRLFEIYLDGQYTVLAADFIKIKQD